MAFVARAAANGGAYRDGKTLVVAQGGHVPPICVKCGQVATGSLFRKKFYWHNPWLFFLILLGVIPYIIAALIERKRMDLQVPLCARHHARYRRRRMISALLMIGGFTLAIVALGFVGLCADSPPPPGRAARSIAMILFLLFLCVDSSPLPGFVALAGLALLLAGMIGWLVAGPLLRPTYIDVRYGAFRGAVEHFLAQLPPKPPGLFS